MLISANGITPIANEERNLPAFKDEEASYLGQADRLSFAYEAIRGDSTGADTTLGQTQIQVAGATSVYAFKKENLSLFLQDFFNDLVMPNLMKDLTPEHIMRFTGTVQELDKLDQAAAEVYANDAVKERILSGQDITIEDQQALKDKAIETFRKQGENRFLKIKDAFYDDVEFEFDFLVTNEQEDPSQIAQNLQTVFMALATNPQMIQDPRIKVLFYKFAEKLGVSPGELELADQQATQMQQAMPQQAPQAPQEGQGMQQQAMQALGAPQA
jgi:hypothetical protein